MQNHRDFPAPPPYSPHPSRSTTPQLGPNKQTASTRPTKPRGQLPNQALLALLQPHLPPPAPAPPWPRRHSAAVPAWHHPWGPESAPVPAWHHPWGPASVPVPAWHHLFCRPCWHPETPRSPGTGEGPRRAQSIPAPLRACQSTQPCPSWCPWCFRRPSLWVLLYLRDPCRLANIPLSQLPAPPAQPLRPPARPIPCIRLFAGAAWAGYPARRTHRPAEAVLRPPVHLWRSGLASQPQPDAGLPPSRRAKAR
mmetsp:Transcript_10003/g.22039  ORF Transcript_10003/g.22039 Transcript_10003/m.22039 type:complete len:252 (-) Transcript_10003:25-780(-)